MVWQDQAACKGRGDLMYIKPGQPWDMVKQVREAQKVCSTCPVQDECLKYALDNPEDSKWGIWGGTTEKQRRAIRKKHKRRLQPV